MHKRASKSKRPTSITAPRSPAKVPTVVKKTWSTSSSVNDPGNEGASSGWSAAERLAAAALRGYGFTDATVTPPGNDGGFDVVGTGIVAQVKYRSRATGRPELQQLVGANTRFAAAAFFSRKGYSRQAVDFADSVGIALFQIELPRTVAPTNKSAFRLVRSQRN
ncbi:restriction endonuclease [Crystallibacter degradans]|uniref:restriction endonuclease n=1 Tax=Crystallibacter degradans TaxID=2726743 RepID=UPI003F839C05